MKIKLKSAQVSSSRPKKVAKNNDYFASIKILGRNYQAQGATAKEAIEKLNVGKVAKGMSILTVTKGEKSCEKVLNHNQTFRLFSLSRMMREVAIKNVSMMFQGL